MKGSGGLDGMVSEHAFLLSGVWKLDLHSECRYGGAYRVPMSLACESSCL